MTPLAVTGIGVVSPVGVGFEAFREALGDPTAARKRAFGVRYVSRWRRHSAMLTRVDRSIARNDFE
jgi:hypothetical protein